MKRLLVSLAGCGALAIALLATAPRAQGDCPQYLILQPTNAGQGRPAPAQTYAYGWFGVCPRHPHAVFHWDFYNYRWIWW